MKSAATLIFDGKADLAEGPVWYDNHLWWVNITTGELSRLDPESGRNQSRATGDLLGAAVPCDDGRWLLARRDDLCLLDWETGDLETVVPLEKQLPHNRSNDGKCDPKGRFWIGTMNLNAEQSAGALYCLASGRQLCPKVDGVTISNGLGWSPGITKFYYIDTATQCIDLFHYDVDTAAITGRYTLVEIPLEQGAPDGMAIDADGNLWVALWGGNAVQCYAGNNGKLLERVELPVSQVSSCCFGGPDLDQLFITTARQGCDQEDLVTEPLAGGIFCCRPGVKGLACTPFRTATLDID